MALDMTANHICEICKMEHNTYSGFIQHVRLGCSGSHMMKSKANSNGLSKSIACKVYEKSFKTYSSLREHIKRSCNSSKCLRNSESEVKHSELEAKEYRKASQKFATVNRKLRSCHEQKKVETDASQQKNSTHEPKTAVIPKVVEHELKAKKSKANSNGLSKSIACKICEKSFKTYSSLREHIKRSCNSPKCLRNSESEVKHSELEAKEYRKASQKFSTVNRKLRSCHVQKKVETDASQQKNSTHEQKSAVIPKVVEHELTDKIFACIDCGKEFNCDFDLQCHKTVHQAENTDLDSRSTVHKKVVPDKRIYTSTKIFSVQPKSPQETSIVLLSEITDFRDSTSPKIQQQITGHELHSERSLIDKELADIDPFLRKEMYVRCKVCASVIKVKSLKAHLAIHNADERFQCVECKKTFKLQSYLRSHMRNHAKESKYECGLCGLKYKKPALLVDHMMRVHALENRLLCDICGKLFTCHSNFRFHKQTHSGERQIHQCDICGKILKAVGTLKAHMHIHTGVKPYKCSICGRGFRQKSNLNYHYRIHTGERLYKCYVCGKDFSDSETLKCHLNRHYGKKPYKCDICDRGFAGPANLRQHRKTHKYTV